jgi:hypothetical protein
VGNLAIWLEAIVWPLAQKVLVGLGVGWLTFEAVTVALDAVRAAVLAHLGSIQGAMLQVLSLSGCMEAVGIILGAVAARASLLILARLGKVTA